MSQRMSTREKRLRRSIVAYTYIIHIRVSVVISKSVLLSDVTILQICLFQSLYACLAAFTDNELQFAATTNMTMMSTIMTSIIVS